MTLSLMSVGALRSFENASYRGRFHIRGAMPWDERIVLIKIDDETLAGLGQFPLSRDIYTQLLERLAVAPPAAIAFNLLLVEPSSADASLAAAMAAQSNVVLATAIDEHGQLLQLAPPLQASAIATGHVLRSIESDGLVHSIDSTVAATPALGLSMAATYPSAQQPIQLPRRSKLWLNWPAPMANLPQHSLIDVLSGRVAPEAFAGKLVIVGMTATGIDELLTPFERNPPSSGVVLHATVLDNALQQRYLQPLNHWSLWILLALSMPGMSYGLTGQRLRWQLMLTAGSCLGWLGLSVLLFAQTYLLPVAAPITLFGLTGTASVLSRKLREGWALQGLLSDLWQSYQKDAVALPKPSSKHAHSDDELGDNVRKLVALADSLGQAQAIQAAIAQTVPVGILAIDEQDRVWFCNALATRWLGFKQGDIITSVLVPHWLDESAWQQMRHRLHNAQAGKSVEQGDRPASDERANVSSKGDEPFPRIERKCESAWFELCFERLHSPSYRPPLLANSDHNLLIVVEDVTHRKAAELQLQLVNAGLEGEVQQQAQLLDLTNANLQQEIIERQQVQKKLAHQALHDELTSLPNRYHFMTRLTATLASIRQDAPNDAAAASQEQRLAVLFLDCDRFKLVNDSYGHLVGDELLKAIAKRLRNCIAQSDMVARLGGDEFTVLLAHIHSLESAIQVAKRILRRLQDPFFLGKHKIYSGCSIGIVISDASYSQADELLRDADIAMYRAKRGGLGYALFRPEMHVQVRDSMRLEMELRQAVQNQELLVYYQPIFAIATQKIEGFEALLRWQHPTQGTVCPGQFIAIAEETGLILPIGRWVLQAACAQMQAWRQQNRLAPHTFLSVNLSVRQFNETNLLTAIDETLQDTGLDGHYLKLEITESAIMANADSAVKTFHHLRDRGILLGIDDFGTGYASLSHLYGFPIDVLKIDPSFIQQMTQGKKYLHIVQTMNTLAADLDITMIAEGVENETQLQQLKTMGCHAGQGYLLGPPVDSRTLETKYLNPPNAPQPNGHQPNGR